VNVAVQVVAHVEDLVSRQPKKLLHQTGVAAEEDAALLDGAEVRLEQPSILVDDLVERIR
jgi:hypothetical protein